MNYWQVQLNNIRFFAFHGVHEEERITGAEFRVDLKVLFGREDPIVQLDQSIDYVRLHKLVKKIMEKPEPLLETVCERIAATIHEDFPFLTEINITVTKISPPVANFRGELAVSLSKSYK